MYRALYDYQPQEETENCLSLRQGDEVVLLQNVDEEWARVQPRSAEGNAGPGVVPRNYLKEVENASYPLYVARKAVYQDNGSEFAAMGAKVEVLLQRSNNDWLVRHTETQAVSSVHARDFLAMTQDDDDQVIDGPITEPLRRYSLKNRFVVERNSTRTRGGASHSASSTPSPMLQDGGMSDAERMNGNSPMPPGAAESPSPQSFDRKNSKKSSIRARLSFRSKPKRTPAEKEERRELLQELDSTMSALKSSKNLRQKAEVRELLTKLQKMRNDVHKGRDFETARAFLKKDGATQETDRPTTPAGYTTAPPSTLTLAHSEFAISDKALSPPQEEAQNGGVSGSPVRGTSPQPPAPGSSGGEMAPELTQGSPAKPQPPQPSLQASPQPSSSLQPAGGDSLQVPDDAGADGMKSPTRSLVSPGPRSRSSSVKIVKPKTQPPPPPPNATSPQKQPTAEPPRTRQRSTTIATMPAGTPPVVDGSPKPSPTGGKTAQVLVTGKHSVSSPQVTGSPVPQITGAVKQLVESARKQSSRPSSGSSTPSLARIASKVMSVGSSQGQATKETARRLVEDVRVKTGSSFDNSCLAARTVLDHMKEYMPSQETEIDELADAIVQLQNSSVTDGGKDSHDAQRLDVIFSELTTMRNDGQQRNWAVHEDEDIIKEYLEELLTILAEADQTLCSSKVGHDEFAILTTLTEYYQMESRVSIRMLLLKLFGGLCSLDSRIPSVLLNTNLPLEMARDIKVDTSQFQKTLYSCLVATMMFSCGEKPPLHYYETWNTVFVLFLLDLVENPSDEDEEERLLDCAIGVVLAFNYHFADIDVSNNFVMKALQATPTTRNFCEKVLLIINREEDPVALGTPLVPDSVLKLLKDMFAERSTASLFYTSDTHVLLGIVARQLNDLPEGSELRYHYLLLLEEMVQTTDFNTDQHGRDEIAIALERIEEGEVVEDRNRETIVRIRCLAPCLQATA